MKSKMSGVSRTLIHIIVVEHSEVESILTLNGKIHIITMIKFPKKDGFHLSQI